MERTRGISRDLMQLLLYQMSVETFKSTSRKLQSRQPMYHPRFEPGTPQLSQHISTMLPLHQPVRTSKLFCSSLIWSVQVLNYISTRVQFLAIKENKEMQKENSQNTGGQRFVGYSVCRHVQRCAHARTHTDVREILVVRLY
jgi:hypothetical protein